MSKKCKKCGKETLGDNYEYCFEHRQFERSSSPASKPHTSNAASSHQTHQGGGLPADYLKSGYFDAEKHLCSELIVAHAKEIAFALDRAGMKAAALRKFFAKVKTIQRNLDANNDFAAMMPEILTLVPYVNNAVTRGVVPAIFRQFIEANVNLASRDQTAFCKGFAKHFEYIVAFFPREK